MKVVFLQVRRGSFEDRQQSKTSKAMEVSGDSGWICQVVGQNEDDSQSVANLGVCNKYVAMRVGG